MTTAPPPATPKTYDLTQGLLTVGGVPLPHNGFEERFRIEFGPAPTDRTPDDVRNDPQVWDVLRFGEGCVLLVTHVTDRYVTLALWNPPMRLARRAVPRGDWPSKLYPTLEYTPGVPPERNGDLPLTEIAGHGCLRLTVGGAA